MAEYLPKDPENDPLYNAKGGEVIVMGSHYQQEKAKWEQHPNKWTGGEAPGNPYRYREYPLMLYRAEMVNGKAVCGAAEPSSVEFKDPQDLARAQTQAEVFNRRCQTIVNDEAERQKAMENGYRETPSEAVAYLENRETEKANITAQREYEDRNLSEAAQKEIREAKDAVGNEHLPEIPRKPVQKRTRVCSKCGETGHNARTCKA